MEKIGFFGGCFNPITNAHVNLIKRVNVLLFLIVFIFIYDI